jgi:hypothetical protein
MLRLASLLGLVWLNIAPSLMACPGCKEPSNVAGASGVSGISAGFSWSVLFMLASVGSIMCGMVFMIVRSCRQLEGVQETSSCSQLSATAPAVGSDIQENSSGLSIQVPT